METKGRGCPSSFNKKARLADQKEADAHPVCTACPSTHSFLTLRSHSWRFLVKFPSKEQVAHKRHDFRDSVMLAEPQRETW